jgi:hypothetical protein
MEPKKKFIKITQKATDETATDLEIENKNISKAIESAEPRIPDVAGLNRDISFADRGYEIENE